MCKAVIEAIIGDDAEAFDTGITPATDTFRSEPEQEDLGLGDSGEEENKLAPDYFGRLDPVKRTKRPGRGIGANVLTSGAGLQNNPKVTRKALIG